MFRGHRVGAFLRRSTFSQSSPNPKCYPFLHLKPYPASSPLSLFSTTATDSDKQSFTVSYFTNNCGFSPQAAAKASKRVRFDDANKPDSVIAFFVNHGFSISQIHTIIRKEPELLLCDPATRVLPKIQFLASKGASTSDTVAIVTGCPYFLRHSLQNHIKPAFEAITRFSQSQSESESDIVITTATKRPGLLRMSLDQISHYSFSTMSDSDKQSFTVSYLTNNCGFSPQAALKASKRVLFDHANKPDSVIAFFTNHGFSISQIHSIVRRAPELLVFNPAKRLLPKFRFLASKGSGIVTTVCRSPFFLLKSFENHILPAFEFVRRFCPSDDKAVACVLICSHTISIDHMKSKVKLLLDMGVAPSNIYILLATWPSILRYADLKEAVEEVKGLGFNPSKVPFISALLAKRAVSKSLWDAKLDAFKKWGCTEDAVLDAFRRHPRLMLFSIKKVNAVMSFWVGHLGWDPSVFLAVPTLFGYSLEKRLRPRALVIQYLLSRGLMKKDASLFTPFSYCDELFLQKFVECFEEEETSKLLSLYQGGC